MFAYSSLFAHQLLRAPVLVGLLASGLAACGKDNAANPAPVQRAEAGVAPDTKASPTCEAQPDCARLGRCRETSGGTGDFCIAGSDAWCAKSEVCRTKGKCKAGWPTDAEKALGVPQDAWDCRPKSIEDCAQVAECKTSECTLEVTERVAVGQFKMELRSCMPKSTVPSTVECSKSDECRKYGMCKSVDGRCEVGTDEDCASSAQCREEGLCVKGKFGCEARKVKHCEDSVACKEAGRCTPTGRGECGFDKSVDCRKYPECKEAGNCAIQHLHSESCGCKVWLCRPAAKADCANSLACQKSGNCSLIKAPVGKECGPASDADCKQSQDCKENGRCKFKRDWNACVTEDG